MNINELFSSDDAPSSKSSYFVTNIEDETLSGENFRKVMYTGNHMQLVIMSLAPGEEIGEEVHEDGDQFIRIEYGQGLFVLAGEEYHCKDGDVALIKSGTSHNLINIGDEPLKLYALYSPPEHEDGVINTYNF